MAFIGLLRRLLAVPSGALIDILSVGRRFRRLTAVGALLAAGLPAVAGADEQALNRLRQQIQRVEAELVQTRDARQGADRRLRDIERDINAGHRKMRALAADIAGARSELARLTRAQAAARARADLHANDLAAQLRAIYMAGPVDHLKLALNQDDAGRAARLLGYHRYLAGAREAAWRKAAAASTAATALQTDVRRTVAKLTELQQAQAAAQGALHQAAAAQRRVVAELHTALQDKDSRLARLRRDERDLGRLLQGLAAPARAFAPGPPPATFAKARGRLPWPVRSGRPRSHWRGAFVPAPAGTPVRAVHAGRVIYADWLRGLGLLLILDHGGGYMTLYGHQQSLSRQVGDAVQAGDTVGTAGTSGGALQPGVYFEIRQDGSARNPLEWCRG